MAKNLKKAQGSETPGEITKALDKLYGAASNKREYYFRALRRERGSGKRPGVRVLEYF
jgi:hypothetical protein